MEKLLNIQTADLQINEIISPIDISDIYAIGVADRE